MQKNKVKRVLAIIGIGLLSASVFVGCKGSSYNVMIPCSYGHANYQELDLEPEREIIHTQKINLVDGDSHWNISNPEDVTRMRGVTHETSIEKILRKLSKKKPEDISYVKMNNAEYPYAIVLNTDDKEYKYLTIYLEDRVAECYENDDCENHTHYRYTTWSASTTPSVKKKIEVNKLF